MNIIENQVFIKTTADYLISLQSTFENCRFVNCDFFEGRLSNLTFSECRFEGCNLALCQLINTGIQNVNFKDCKLSGADFSKSNDFLFEINCENCLMDNAIFYRKKIKGASFSNCSMVETDFTETDLTNTTFDNCNLNRAFFNRTQLKNADFTTSYNFTIDPDINFVKKAKFSLHGLPGLLSKYDIIVK